MSNSQRTEIDVTGPFFGLPDTLDVEISIEVSAGVDGHRKASVTLAGKLERAVESEIQEFGETLSEATDE